MSAYVIVEFTVKDPDVYRDQCSARETAVSWYNSPEYQQLIDVRSVAMDARFSLLDGLAS